ncbi:conserved protein, unknown function [Plasmodium reichenowi]|uniref:DUF155 domain-containing protein n=1 Tax=Plasmodium reichenowi TaxID=5854 RepID=A0A151LFA7_PLARE|nr:conserved protein, unknown function [Plasmodium reichenowi]KYN97641.1 conserved protein, unknown function [Plasmodium reichenowi]
MVHIQESSYNSQKNNDKIICIRKNENCRITYHNLYDEFFSSSERDNNNVYRRSQYKDKKIIDNCLYNYKNSSTLKRKNKNKLIKVKTECVHNNIFFSDTDLNNKKKHDAHNMNFKCHKAYSVDNTSFDYNNNNKKYIYNNNNKKYIYNNNNKKYIYNNNKKYIYNNNKKYIYNNKKKYIYNNKKKYIYNNKKKNINNNNDNKFIYLTNSFQNDVNSFSHYKRRNYKKKKEMDIKYKSKTNDDIYKEMKNMIKKEYIKFDDIKKNPNKYYDVLKNNKKDISFLLSNSNDNIIYRNNHKSIYNNLEKMTDPKLGPFENMNNLTTNIKNKKYYPNITNEYVSHNNYYNDITEDEENNIIKINMNPIYHSTNSSYVTRCNHLFSVKLLCHAKCYNLIKISHIFFSKQITYKWFDNYNILCAFLSPEKEVHEFYSSVDFYKIENLNLKKNVTSSKSCKYILFIFKNGSVIIWENFNNHKKNHNFIKKILLFLNSFSDELLPVYLEQEDTIFFFQGHQHNKWNGQCVTNMKKNNIIKKKAKRNNSYLFKKKDKTKKCIHIIKKNSRQNDKNNYNKSNELREMKKKKKKKKLKIKVSYEQKRKKENNINTFVNNGVIYLTNTSLEQKLTASFALSQSIQLDVHEMMMDIAINTLFKISKEIAKKGTCIISKETISRMMNVYSSIINVNAVQDFLDIPEYFWNKVEYEHAWFEIYKYMEIPERIKILNKRYNYYKDFLKVIKTEVYNKKTFYTYRIVMLLLFIHVLALLLNDFLFV